MAVVVVAVMVMMTRLVGPCHATVHKVGDSAGWTTIGNVNYKQWAASRNFQLGDTIVFEYNPQFHNVMRVTHQMYRACNASTPLAAFTTGNDSITLTNHGHHFFFCGVPGHCQAGQKVDINVLRSSPSSVSSPPLASTVPAASVPGPSPSKAASLGTWVPLRIMAMLTASLVLGLPIVPY